MFQRRPPASIQPSAARHSSASNRPNISPRRTRVAAMRPISASVNSAVIIASSFPVFQLNCQLDPYGEDRESRFRFALLPELTQKREMARKTDRIFQPPFCISDWYRKLIEIGRARWGFKASAA